MPQDVPLEASETLAFTPASLAHLPDPPTFTLRAATHREKRYQQRLMREEGLVQHSEADIRAEVLNGLRALWTEADYETFAPFLQQYWEALDDFAPQKTERDEEIAEAREKGEDPPPELEFPFDKDLATRCEALIVNVTKSHRPLGAMRADNAEVLEMSAPIIVAVIVKDWSNLDARAERERGYTTLGCAYEIMEALKKVEKDHDLKPGAAWGELQLACLARMFLDEDLAKNFVSPSPSDMPQQPSNETNISAEDGTFPASASSTTETPSTE